QMPRPRPTTHLCPAFRHPQVDLCELEIVVRGSLAQQSHSREICESRALRGSREMRALTLNLDYFSMLISVSLCNAAQRFRVDRVEAVSGVPPRREDLAAYHQVEMRAAPVLEQGDLVGCPSSDPACNQVVEVPEHVRSGDHAP